VPTKPPAVVVGLDCITGLQTARILAARGVPVTAVARDLSHYCSRTRVCAEIVRSELEGPELIATLSRIARTFEHKAVLFPCTDETVLLVSRHRHELEAGYHVALPDHETVEMLMDKVSFYEHAERAGLAIPRTAVLAGRDDAERVAATFPFPIILKPPSKSAPEWRRHLDKKGVKLRSADQLLALYDRVSGGAETLIAQQWVEGGDASLFSCNCYFGADSRPLVMFVARKLRQWPPRIGTSSLGEECRNDVVLEETLRLFHGVGFRGLGYLEMKQDARTGEHFIIEPNIGRPTGRSAIAEAGGVELLYTMYCDAVGLPLPAGLEQRYTGAKWVDLRRDFQSALHYWRHGELSLREWRRSWSGRKAHAVLSWSDPAPFWFDIWQSAGKAARLVRSVGP
jgi:predicted ATP-grasp superfamily ATP-dependent carboligase